MCDYCDCRRIPEIRDLGAEHDRIEELGDAALAALRRGDPDAPAAIGRLVTALDPHVNREESGVFREARRAGLGAYYVDDLEEDHRRFDAALSDPDSLDPDALESLLDELHRHIAIEEYDLFPAAAQTLTDEQWETIDRIEVVNSG
ncbi:MAG TPA: hemerythrin domain-containing protein [Acidimicrobiia bacterium]|nr:hemerythrin domain-containing protein [Acidimicrobiia bacterium]